MDDAVWNKRQRSEHMRSIPCLVLSQNDNWISETRTRIELGIVFLHFFSFDAEVVVFLYTQEVAYSNVAVNPFPSDPESIVHRTSLTCIFLHCSSTSSSSSNEAHEVNNCLFAHKLVFLSTWSKFFLYTCEQLLTKIEEWTNVVLITVWRLFCALS